MNGGVDVGLAEVKPVEVAPKDAGLEVKETAPKVWPLVSWKVMVVGSVLLLAPALA